MSDRDLDSERGDFADVTQKNLPEVRSELRRLGYLDHKVERYLLQDAMKPERPLETLAHLAVKVGLMIGLPSALLAALVLAGANGHLQSSPFDLLPLFAHLVPWAVLVPGLSFLGLAGLLAVFLRWTHVRRIEAVSLGLAMMTAALAVLVVLQQIGWQELFLLPRWQLAALVGLLPPFTYLVFKVVHGGLLTLAIRLTDLTPEQPSSFGRWVVLGLVLVTFLLMLPAALEVEKTKPKAPVALPVTAGNQVVVIGVDGVLPQELDYLIAAGELPAIERLASRGVRATYERSTESPIAFWTTIATGLPSSEHGLESLDSFRPAGVTRPLRRNGWIRHLWSVGARFDLVEYRPVLAKNRRAWSFWELASRGGAKSLIVGWWGTFPVEPVPGMVIAHGGYQLLGEGSELAVHPPAAAVEMARLAAELEPSAQISSGLSRVLPEAGFETIVDEVVSSDAFYLDAFRRRLEGSPRAAALYLSGLDIAAAKLDLGTVAFGDLVRRRLREVDDLVAGLIEPDPTSSSARAMVVLVVDPGRRGADHGRAFIHVDGGPEADIEITPEAIGASIIRALGLPQSRELPLPPADCGLPKPPMTVDTYGPRQSSVVLDEEGDSDEYLENLKSLGYL